MDIGQKRTSTSKVATRQEKLTENLVPRNLDLERCRVRQNPPV